MQQNQSERKAWYQLDRVKFFVVEEDSLRERAMFTIRPRQFLLYLLMAVVLFVFLMWSLFKFTPLRRTVGVHDEQINHDQIKYLMAKVVEMEKTIRTQDLYILRIRSLVSGQPIENLVDSVELSEVMKANFEAVDRVDEDSSLRLLVEERGRSKAKLAESAMEENAQALLGPSNLTFFVPVTGEVSKGFDLSTNHFGIDILAPKNTAIKAALPGEVIFSDWSRETGYTIGVQHDNNLLSFYKHNSALLKNVGDHVEAGEAVSIIGNSGENSTGPHLHFELWHNGSPLNPSEYLKFN